MKDRHLILASVIAAILAGAELIVILTTVTPIEADPPVLWTFFICLFVLLTSVSSLIWHSIKSSVHPRLKPSRAKSMRQAALLAAVITSTLFLRSLGVVSSWDIIPLAVSALLIEFFFQADKRPSYHDAA